MGWDGMDKKIFYILLHTLQDTAPAISEAAGKTRTCKQIGHPNWLAVRQGRVADRLKEAG